MKNLIILLMALLGLGVWSCGDNDGPTPEPEDYSDTTKWFLCEDFVDTFVAPYAEGDVVRYGVDAITKTTLDDVWRKYHIALRFRDGRRTGRPITRKESPREYDSICRRNGITGPFNHYLPRPTSGVDSHGRPVYVNVAMLWRNIIADEIDSVRVVSRYEAYNSRHPKGSSLNDIVYLNYVSPYDYIMNDYSWKGVMLGNGFYPCDVKNYFEWVSIKWHPVVNMPLFNAPFGYDLYKMYKHTLLSDKSSFPLRMVVSTGMWLYFAEKPDKDMAECSITFYIRGSDDTSASFVLKKSN